MTGVSTLDLTGLTANEYRAVMDDLGVEARPEGGIRFLQAQRHDGSASFVGGREGLRGEGGFTADLGQGAEMTLDYWFE